MYDGLVRELRVFVIAYALIVALAAPPALLADDGSSSKSSPTSTNALPPGPAEPGLPPGAAGPSASSTPTAESGSTQSSDASDSKGSKKRKSSLDTASAAASKAVTIKDFEFTPKSITVNVGDTVEWTNNGPTGHSATSDESGQWDTGVLKKGASGSHTFNQAGTFKYHCTPHPNMKATITVADTGGSSSSSSGSSDTGATGSSTGTGSTGSTGSSSGSGSGKSLAGTGADLYLWAAVGAGLVALGFGLRRRRPRSR